jgi:hypothetical protein
VPGISDPPTQILHWNREIPNFLTIMISYAPAYLHDNGAFLLFYHDGSNVRKDISGYFKNYNSKTKDESTIINCLHLANLVNPNKNISILYSLKLPSSFYYNLRLFSSVISIILCFNLYM